jgi:hypothetical protein
VAYLMLEASVRTHPKFLQAGPEASWLWVCGLGYCQDGLTDGFIPDAAVEYLGVKRARLLARRLVSVKLWDVVEGGWQMHDYLEHNKPATEVREIMRKRREGGKKGGRPRKDSENLEGYENENLEGKPSSKTFPETPTVLPSDLPLLPDQDQNQPPPKARRDALPVEKSETGKAKADETRTESPPVQAPLRDRQGGDGERSEHRRRGVEGADEGRVSAAELQDPHGPVGAGSGAIGSRAGAETDSRAAADSRHSSAVDALQPTTGRAEGIMDQTPAGVVPRAGVDGRVTGGADRLYAIVAAAVRGQPS